MFESISYQSVERTISNTTDTLPSSFLEIYLLQAHLNNDNNKYEKSPTDKIFRLILFRCNMTFHALLIVSIPPPKKKPQKIHYH